MSNLTTMGTEKLTEIYTDQLTQQISKLLLFLGVYKTVDTLSPPPNNTMTAQAKQLGKKMIATEVAHTTLDVLSQSEILSPTIKKTWDRLAMDAKEFIQPFAQLKAKDEVETLKKIGYHFTADFPGQPQIRENMIGAFYNIPHTTGQILATSLEYLWTTKEKACEATKQVLNTTLDLAAFVTHRAPKLIRLPGQVLPLIEEATGLSQPVVALGCVGTSLLAGYGLYCLGRAGWQNICQYTSVQNHAIASSVGNALTLNLMIPQKDNHDRVEIRKPNLGR